MLAIGRAPRHGLKAGCRAGDRLLAVLAIGSQRCRAGDRLLAAVLAIGYCCFLPLTFDCSLTYNNLYYYYYSYHQCFYASIISITTTAATATNTITITVNTTTQCHVNVGV